MAQRQTLQRANCVAAQARRHAFLQQTSRLDGRQLAHALARKQVRRGAAAHPGGVARKQLVVLGGAQLPHDAQLHDKLRQEEERRRHMTACQEPAWH